MTSGLKGHKVAAVYAILNSSYKRSDGEGWEHVQHVSITKDLAHDLNYFVSAKNESGNDVANVRALSFSYPQKGTMMDFANGWKAKVLEAGGSAIAAGEGWGIVPQDFDGAATATTAAVATATAPEGEEGESTQQQQTIITVGDEYEFDDDDEDMDEDDLDDYLQMMAESRAAVSSSLSSPQAAAAPLFVDNTGLSSIESLAPPESKSVNDDEEAVISPFDAATNAASAAVQSAFGGEDATPLELTVENVDKVLDEVRPYLISDGGNVSVQNVESTTGNVYLLLEGACGSCASSTVTMKMGIERVLKEKFDDKLGEVIQVDPDEGNGENGTPTELTLEAVQEEVNRISTAIIAMGGVVRVLDVDSALGVVEVEFRGPNRVKKGLELAILDVEFVKHVKFVS